MKFSIPQKYRLSTLLYNKKFAIALSIVLSFSLWLGIAMTENPIREQTFTDIKASVSLKGTAAEALGLDIISDHSADRFSITVSGPNYVVSSLKADDFSLTASTIKINTAGEYELELVAQSTNNKSGYTITSISPSTISVSVDFIESKDFTIVPKPIGVSASEGLVLDTPIITDLQQSTINIKGPRSKMEKIHSVAAVADVNEVLSSTDSFDSDIVLYDKDNKIIYRFTSDGTVYDANGNIISKSPLTPSFKSVTVTQPISKQKVVPCVPVFNNLPDGMTLSDIKYTLNWDELTIQGPPEVIDQIEQISLSPIDFRDVSISQNDFEVSATLPNGVKMLESVEFFTVDVDLTGYAEKMIDVSKIEPIGLSKDYIVTNNKSVRVKLCGPSAVIKRIKSDDLYIYLDLTDKKVGMCTVDVLVKSDVYNNVWQTGTYETTVTISKSK